MVEPEEQIRITASVALEYAKDGTGLYTICRRHGICGNTLGAWRKRYTHVCWAWSNPKVALSWLADNLYSPGSWRQKIAERMSDVVGLR
jgi:hypothetical protein